MHPGRIAVVAMFAFNGVVVGTWTSRVPAVTGHVHGMGHETLRGRMRNLRQPASSDAVGGAFAQDGGTSGDNAGRRKSVSLCS